MSGSTGGAHASENAGISSDHRGENPLRRKPKVSPAMFVRRRLGGPKARPEGVADGHLVDIPDPGYEPGEDVLQILIPHRWLLRARPKL